LDRAEPDTLDKLLNIANKYANADGATKIQIRVYKNGKVITKTEKSGEPGSSSRRRDHDRHDKRRSAEQQPNNRPDTKQVAAVADQPAAKKRSHDNGAPCKFHGGAGKATHTTRQCAWAKRLMNGEGLPPPPPSPENGAAGGAAQPARAGGNNYPAGKETNFCVFASTDAFDPKKEEAAAELEAERRRLWVEANRIAKAISRLDITAPDLHPRRQNFKNPKPTLPTYKTSAPTAKHHHTRRASAATS
jgi:hypothetical protein